MYIRARTSSEYIQTTNKTKRSDFCFLHFHIPAGLHKASHRSLAFLPVSATEVWSGERVGLTDTAMLITMWLSAMEKQGLECFVHLEGPLSMASCSLKAYGLKWQ